jgi:hypothetical protein
VGLRNVRATRKDENIIGQAGAIPFVFQLLCRCRHYKLFYQNVSLRIRSEGLLQNAGAVSIIWLALMSLGCVSPTRQFVETGVFVWVFCCVKGVCPGLVVYGIECKFAYLEGGAKEAKREEMMPFEVFVKRKIWSVRVEGGRFRVFGAGTRDMLVLEEASIIRFQSL